MRIVIIGAGDAGRQLARHLCEERHDVVMVDIDAAALADVETKMDVLTVRGYGASPRVLEEAGAGKSDLLLAVSNSNQTNILSSLYAKHIGVGSAVARITRADFAREEFNAMGVDHLVNEHEACARELSHVIRIPAAHEATDLFDGRILGVGMLVGMDSPLLTHPLARLPERDRLASIRFVVCRRGKETFIPDGRTQFMIGDDVYLLGQPEAVEDVVAWANPSVQPFRRIVIAGGGSMGRPLLRILRGRDVVVIESDEAKAHDLSERFAGCLVLHGDCLDQQTLEDAGLNEHTAYLATTGNDQNNMVSCMLADKLGAAFTAARITRAQFAPVINSLSLLDRVVNPYRALFNSIMHFVRGPNVKLEARLEDVDGRVLEFDLRTDHPWAGCQVMDLDVPEGAMLGMVMRGQQIIVVTGATELRAGDRLAVFSLAKAVKAVSRALA